MLSMMYRELTFRSVARSSLTRFWLAFSRSAPLPRGGRDCPARAPARKGMRASFMRAWFSRLGARRILLKNRWIGVVEVCVVGTGVRLAGISGILKSTDERHAASFHRSGRRADYARRL